jgi:hypothetical protein
MRPIRVIALQQEHGIDLVCVGVLDVLSDFSGMIPTQKLVDACQQDKIATPATTHKKLAVLKEKKWMKEVKNPADNDGRKCYITITDAGLKFLLAWEGGKT